jgi:hypothetical protein
VRVSQPTNLSSGIEFEADLAGEFSNHTVVDKSRIWRRPADVLFGRHLNFKWRSKKNLKRNRLNLHEKLSPTWKVELPGSFFHFILLESRCVRANQSPSDLTMPPIARFANVSIESNLIMTSLAEERRGDNDKRALNRAASSAISDFSRLNNHHQPPARYNALADPDKRRREDFE